MKIELPEETRAIIQTVRKLAGDDHYLGAFLFGSFARGDFNKDSDIDLRIITNQDNLCGNINHPIINNRKTDLTFTSLNQLIAATQHEIKIAKRPPWIQESIIIFDKTGELSKLKAQTRKIRPPKLSVTERQNIRYFVLNIDQKFKKNLIKRPKTALLVLHTSLGELIDYHFKIKRHWLVSNKRQLNELKNWDPAMAQLVSEYLTTSNLKPKVNLWNQIIDYILQPLGGRIPIDDINCSCRTCRRDLKAIDSLLRGNDNRMTTDLV